MLTNKNLFSNACKLVLCAVLLTSCSEEYKEKQNIQQEEENKGRAVYDFGWHQQIRVYEVDSCEYIGFSGTSDGGTSIIHKENCKFCAQRSSK